MNRICFECDNLQNDTGPCISCGGSCEDLTGDDAVAKAVAATARLSRSSEAWSDTQKAEYQKLLSDLRLHANFTHSGASFSASWPSGASAGRVKFVCPACGSTARFPPEAWGVCIPCAVTMVVDG